MTGTGTRRSVMRSAFNLKLTNMSPANRGAMATICIDDTLHNSLPLTYFIRMLWFHEDIVMEKTRN